MIQQKRIQKKRPSQNYFFYKYTFVQEQTRTEKYPSGA